MFIEIESEQMEKFAKAFEEGKIKKEFLEECKQSAIKTGRIEEGREDLRLRVIYTQDARFENCPVFELDLETGYFEMLEDKRFRYKSEEVYEDEDFLIFAVYKKNKGDEVETVEYLR